MSLAQPPGSVTELLERLDGIAEALPKRLRRCADFTRRHLHLIAVSTVSDMASACEVAPSVYMRFCQALGFSGYSEMQNLFRASYTSFRPDYDERLATLRAEGAVKSGRILGDLAEAGHKSILALANTVTNQKLDQISKSLASARVIHLVGLRRAFAVVSSMDYLLDQLGVPASVHSVAGMMNSRQSIVSGDAVFAVTYAPFSSETVELARDAAERGIPVFGLTDSENCPLFEFAEDVLIARESEVSGFRALNASITLAVALSVSISAIREEVDTTSK